MMNIPPVEVIRRDLFEFKTDKGNEIDAILNENCTKIVLEDKKLKISFIVTESDSTYEINNILKELAYLDLILWNSDSSEVVLSYNINLLGLIKTRMKFDFSTKPLVKEYIYKVSY